MPLQKKLKRIRWPERLNLRRVRHTTSGKEHVLTANAPYIYSSPVRFTHTDPAGYVFFPRFFDKFQAAIEDWFNFELHCDYAGLFLTQGIGLPTAHTECSFLKPCLLGEILDLKVVLQKIGTTSITVAFLGSVASEQRLQAQSVLVFIDLKDGQPVAIPEELRTKLKRYQDVCIE
jgi:4-hydroxybenzoyl-CoA thioesterase